MHAQPLRIADGVQRQGQTVASRVVAVAHIPLVGTPAVHRRRRRQVAEIHRAGGRCRRREGPHVVGCERITRQILGPADFP